MKKDLRQFLLSLIQKDDGLFLKQNQNLYAGSRSYDNALVGLALVSLLDPDEDSCASGAKAISPLSIVDDPSKKAGEENSKENKPTEKPKLRFVNPKTIPRPSIQHSDKGN